MEIICQQKDSKSSDYLLSFFSKEIRYVYTVLIIDWY